MSKMQLANPRRLEEEVLFGLTLGSVIGLA